ncbi:MAG: hypothetical protein HOJ09_01060 [Gammaproteobacteria bacterium]|jgi:hypothetical protein|nr:hypothetical protein [Gammaproteobacteria bacterium]
MAFLNQHQLIEIRTNSDQKAEQHLSHVYGPVLGPALYRACARVWGAGPAVTSARLSNTKELIQAAWLLRDSIAGVLIRKEGLSFLPIYLSSEALAYKLCGKADFWISFNEIKGEIKSLLQQP